ncbi:hypothetical protein N7539_000625 [Penicillium diatomitis]|uniref:Uncharacterized protein n=1 Tax=Penicillium diatomitis TaxID=2819901 RepID=A0A9W9XM58_9EURO|nr:uncharacterized protein N7539_000625 [Penicillium diatomitis]KAJ5495509.1 hypothetical protein N7539_000625 [Penicillium diatomitis]
MSSGLPYLNKLRKPELVEFAEKTDLQDFSDLNKSELAVTLDKHLSSNRTIFAGEKSLADYYKRLSAPPRGGSPVKREPKVEVPGSVKKTPGRKPAAQRQEEASSSEEPPSRTVTKSPKSPVSPTEVVRRSAHRARAVLDVPPSPAVVTDVIDRQTTRVREGIEQAWTSSGVTERTHSLRANLSSLFAIEALVVLVEAYTVVSDQLPNRFLTTIDANRTFHTPAIPVKVPDLFRLLTPGFWGTFTLWLLTNLIVPLVAAYFFNLSWYAATGGGARRGRSSSSISTFDPITFNIAKALMVWKVYVQGFSFWGMYSKIALEKVNAAVPGNYYGMWTGAAIGVLGALYEAILRRQ